MNNKDSEFLPFIIFCTYIYSKYSEDCNRTRFLMSYSNSKEKRTIYTVEDIDEMKGLAFDAISHSTPPGNHIHLKLIPGDKDVGPPTIKSTLVCAKENPMKYMQCLERLRRRKVISEEVYSRYMNGEKTGEKPFFSSGPWIIYPGKDSDEFSLKVDLGEASSDPKTPFTPTLHALALEDLVMTMYNRTCDMLDADANLRRDVLLGSGLSPKDVVAQVKLPCRDWIDSPVSQAYYEKDVVIGNVEKKMGELIDSRPGVISIKPILSKKDASSKGSLSEGSFRYNPTGDRSLDCSPDGVWWTRVDYIAKMGKRKILKTAKSFDEVLKFMYCTESRLAENPKTKIGKKEYFNLKVDVSFQLPSLYVVKGKGHFMFRSFGITILQSKKMKGREVNPEVVSFYENIAQDFSSSDEEESDDDDEVIGLAESRDDIDFASGRSADDDIRGRLNDIKSPKVSEPKFKTNTVMVFPEKKTAAENSKQSDSMMGEEEEEFHTEPMEMPVESGRKKRKDLSSTDSAPSSKRSRKG